MQVSCEGFLPDSGMLAQPTRTAAMIGEQL
jgi:hypothetical protein